VSGRIGASLLALALAACTQDFGVFEGDATTLDASGSDAAEDVGVDVTSDTGGDAAMEADVVQPPALCDAGTFFCVYCAADGGTTGHCTNFHQACSGPPGGYSNCSCTTSSTCPEPDDVCTTKSQCHPCGDSNGNGGLACKGGGTCNASTGVCN
jgi:hypothetical protein